MQDKTMFEFKYERFDLSCGDYITVTFFVDWEHIKKFVPLYNHIYQTNFNAFEFVEQYDNFSTDEWDYFHDWAVENNCSYKQVFYPENKLEDLS